MIFLEEKLVREIILTHYFLIKESRKKSLTWKEMEIIDRITDMIAADVTYAQILALQYAYNS